MFLLRLRSLFVLSVTSRLVVETIERMSERDWQPSTSRLSATVPSPAPGRRHAPVRGTRARGCASRRRSANRRSAATAAVWFFEFSPRSGLSLSPPRRLSASSQDRIEGKPVSVTACWVGCGCQWGHPRAVPPSRLSHTHLSGVLLYHTTRAPLEKVYVVGGRIRWSVGQLGYFRGFLFGVLSPG